jgi:hypothetical protein
MSICIARNGIIGTLSASKLTKLNPSEKVVFVLSENSQVGLTLAPKLLEILTEWEIKNKLDERVLLFKPDRQPISLNTVTESIDYLIKSRIGNAIQHGRIINNERSKISETQKIKFSAVDLVKKLEEKCPNLDVSSIDPDDQSILL